MNKRIELKDDRRGDVYDLPLSLLQLRSTPSGNAQIFVGNEWRPVSGFTFVSLQSYINNKVYTNP